MDIKVPTLAVLCSERREDSDAIARYSELLTLALRATGRVDASLHIRTRAGSTASTRALALYDAVILQYNPFLYGRWGFAPWLPLLLRRLRRGSDHRTIALMVHEPYVPMVNWRWALMGLWQRAQLTALRAEADVVFASIEAWTCALGRRLPHRRTAHLPVPSNLPDRRASRTDVRKGLGVGEDTLVLAAFGTGHPTRLTSFIVAAANAVAETRGRVLLLNLGAGAPTLRGLDARVELHEPGLQTEDALARGLAAADIFLIPLVDGVSTRRGALMAALQHGLAVVGTFGPLTGPLLRHHNALRLVPVARPDLFAAAAVELAASPTERRRIGKAARLLYAGTFDWPVLAERLVNELRLTPAPFSTRR